MQIDEEEFQKYRKEFPDLREEILRTIMEARKADEARCIDYQGQYDAFIAELERRGFVGMEGICSMATCHKDFTHWLLLTDGLLYYSNYPFVHDRPSGDMYKTSWACLYPESEDEQFSFEKLEKEMKFVEDMGVAERVIPFDMLPREEQEALLAKYKVKNNECSISTN
jgi:hypothetical protein